MNHLTSLIDIVLQRALLVYCLRCMSISKYADEWQVNGLHMKTNCLTHRLQYPTETVVHKQLLYLQNLQYRLTN